MNDAPILSDDEPVSMPSMPTQWGGDPAALGRIDHYDILRKLGGGGFGVVYLAKDTVSGVEVAIKTLHPLLKHNADEMDLLREKFRLVSRLSHPNIATALVLHPCRDINIRDEAARRELRLSSGDSVMVMRYAPGVTLSKWRRQFPDGIVPLDLALEVGRQVAAALDYAHGERIVHRDVKPGNIMVETLEGGGIRARILDFGLAAEIRSSMSRVSTEQGDTSGTRPYMAPEQWLGRKQDGRTDQYALACVLYELLSGAPPFAGVFETGDPIIMRTAVTTDAPEAIEGLGSATNVSLFRALAKAPKDRFPSCAAFIVALSTAERTEGIGTEKHRESGNDSVRAPSMPLTQSHEAKEAGEERTIFVGSRKIVLRWCPPGSFLMGSQESEANRFSNETQHRVTLTKGFWIGETEVTQGLWEETMGSNPSQFQLGDEYPVESLTWNDCQTFLKELNSRIPVAGFEWRLPTEAQWEYACRAGTTTAFFWGDSLNGDKANCDGSIPCGTMEKGSFIRKTTPVKNYAPNAWGLYDMHGNVWEWCADWYGSYPSGATTDPSGPNSGSNHVYRGGSWDFCAGFCRSAFRGSLSWIYRDRLLLGLRVVLVPVS